MDLQEKLAQIFKQYSLPIILGGVGFVLLLYGLIQSVSPANNEEVQFEAGVNAEDASTSAGLSSKQIIIDVEGAVLKPGVYALSVDARVQDALIAAGGMSEEADREKVAKGMNLAGRLTDGGKIYIPFIGDTTAVAQGGSSGASGGVLGESNGGLININSATATELDSLTGVGPATAEKIIANRPYEKIEDLVAKKAVGASVFEKIKDRISVY